MDFPPPFLLIYATICFVEGKELTRRTRGAGGGAFPCFIKVLQHPQGLFWGTVVISATPLTTLIFVSGEEKNDFMNL